MKTRRTVEYGHWSPALSAEAIFQTSEQFAFMRPLPPHGAEARNGKKERRNGTGPALLFLMNVPEEKNAQALMYLTHPGARPLRVSPSGMNIRSRVHEYGGMPWIFADNAVFYCQLDDQRIYRQPFNPVTGESGPPTALTPSSGPQAMLRYADFAYDEARRRLICMREDHRRTGQSGDEEAENTLVAVNIDKGGEGEILFSGSDFVASPCISPDGLKLAFQSWSHPHMPWDQTRLHVADITADGELENLRELEQATPGAVLQPRFGPEGALYFLADWNNWWNLYRIDRTDLDTLASPQLLLPLEAECCGPQWQLGYRNYDIIDEQRLLVTVNRNNQWELAILDIKEGKLQTLTEGYGSLEPVFWHQDSAVFCGAATDEAPAIYRQAPADRNPQPLFRCHSAAMLPAEDISHPQHISWPSTDNAEAHGIFYSPCNSACQAPAGTLPPLLVFVHGGPTGTARTAYNAAVQFWTTRGFAVLDVNHRGSTGYGREFRHSLYGNWGVNDVEDIISGVEQLISQRRVDAKKIAIRGGSAGGYAVLSALVKSELFSAGASYYGVSDLSLLAADTHKFESRYLDQLIGPWPEAEAVYQERSPLTHITRITAPILLLQGAQDKVVPPNQAEAIFKQLQASNPASQLIVFDEEAHGFRQPANQIHALNSELAFYQKTML